MHRDTGTGVSGQPGARPLILASASPRRSELLSRLNVSFAVCPANVDEDAPKYSPRAEQIARQLARAKADAVGLRHPDAVILAADTIVVDQGQLLGKPACADEAREMLRSLRGRWHRVITGVVVRHGRRSAVSHTITRVQMRAYSDSEIEHYIERGEPFDKAGAYAIQDTLFYPVERYDGCYCNVVGLPLAPVMTMLGTAGIHSSRESLPAQCSCCPLFRSDFDALNTGNG
jgi:MAF protein